MNISVSPEDFRIAFRSRYSPIFARDLTQIIDQSALRSRTLCETEFVSGGFGVTQGVIRWQYIEDGCRTQLGDSGIVPETRDFNGNLLDGAENINNFTLLRSNEVGLIICRVREPFNLPKKAVIRDYMAALPFPYEPLFADMFERQIQDLKALYVARYWLDEEDSTNALVKDIDVVVLNYDCKSIFCNVCDLREYAQEAYIDGLTYQPDQPLPMSFRNANETPSIESDSDTLPITLRKPDGND